MNLYIEHFPNKHFDFSLFNYKFGRFSIDINQSVKEKIGKIEELTNALALKIFKQIKLKSDVLSFLMKPVVCIPLSLAVLAAGLVIPPSGMILTAIGIILSALGGGMLGFSIENTYNDFLPQLSQAYSDQSKRAAEYINQLESSNQEFTFIDDPNLQLFQNLGLFLN